MNAIDNYLELLRIGAYCAIGAFILGIVNLVILTRHLKGPQTRQIQNPPSSPRIPPPPSSPYTQPTSGPVHPTFWYDQEQGKWRES